MTEKLDLQPFDDSYWQIYSNATGKEPKVASDLTYSNDYSDYVGEMVVDETGICLMFESTDYTDVQGNPQQRHFKCTVQNQYIAELIVRKEIISTTITDEELKMLGFVCTLY